MKFEKLIMWAITGLALFVLILSGIGFMLDKNPPVNKTNFPIWKTITIGSTNDGKSLHNLLINNNITVDAWASDVLDQPRFPVNDKATSVDLVKITGQELGISKGKYISTQEAVRLGEKLGLGLPPAEVAPQLRLQYEDEQKPDNVIIPIKPISDKNGSDGIFYISKAIDGTQKLGGLIMPGMWGFNDSFVFVQSK